MRLILIILIVVLLAGIGLWWMWRKTNTPSPEMIAAAYETPMPPHEGPLRVYHLGHSLVGRDMPAMLAQLAGPGHRYESQLGWGVSLKEHWDLGRGINGFDAENDHDRFRAAKEAISSGDYDAVILTEMVELRDAIRYHDSSRAFARWADLARAAAPETRVYLYETWHRLDDPDGWLTRLDGDLAALWEDKLLLPDLARNPTRPAWVIPAGQVMAAFVRAVEERGGVDGITGREDLFARAQDGTVDTIHLNDLGHYLVALTHYAVLYRQPADGLPHLLLRADGSAAMAPSAEAASLMQQVVRDVVTSYAKTGVAP